MLGLLSVLLELRATGLVYCFSNFNVYMDSLGSCKNEGSDSIGLG